MVKVWRCFTKWEQVTRTPGRERAMTNVHDGEFEETSTHK